MNDELGEKMKKYEAVTTSATLIPNSLVYARLDGRAFHTFTRGMERPFDSRLASCMNDTVHFLVKELNPSLAYTQSDEISLAWLKTSQCPFEGKLYKLQSILASMATSSFTLSCLKNGLDEYVKKHPPMFDCRIFNMPSENEMANMFLWREIDAIRNSISSFAQAQFSHKQLHGKKTSDMKKMLLDKGINWDSLPLNQQRGRYFKRVVREIDCPDNIPTQYRPESGKIIRSFVEEVEFLPLNSMGDSLFKIFY